MPTWLAAAQFEREWAALTKAQRALFRVALRKFIADLASGQFRASLHVKGYRGERGVFEMTWAPDGRALFSYGAEVHPGEPHVVWLRIGGHEIF